MTSTYDVAHINEQGVDLIIIPLDSNFHHRTVQEQHAFKQGAQACAVRAGLRGTVVPVWEYGSYFYFIAPQNYEGFFKSIDMFFVSTNINRTLTCG